MKQGGTHMSYFCIDIPSHSSSGVVKWPTCLDKLYFCHAMQLCRVDKAYTELELALL